VIPQISGFLNLSLGGTSARKPAEKKSKKSDLKTLEKPQHFRLSSPKMPKPIRMQQHPLGI
jgi:hypothetical protein